MNDEFIIVHTKCLTHQKVYWFGEQIGILLCGRHRTKSSYKHPKEFIQFLTDTGITFLNCSHYEGLTVNNKRKY